MKWNFINRKWINEILIHRHVRQLSPASHVRDVNFYFMFRAVMYNAIH